MSSFKDLTGKRFGRLVVIERVESHIQPNGQRKTQWLCQCDCGEKIIIKASDLKSGHTRSCGCLRIEKITKHGLFGTRIYIIWHNIKHRCYNPKDSNYKNYGSRGITMCKEWLNDFHSFYNWAMTNGYDENAKRGECTIDRIDVNGNYVPSNCRFVNIKIQQSNKTNNHLITYNGETHNISEWSEILNIKFGTLFARLKRGWSIEKTLTMPVRKKNKKLS